MKKIIILLGFVFLLSGCFKNKEENLISYAKNKLDNSKNYQLVGTLSIYRNEEKYTYDIISSYKKENYFKVDLKNKTNNHQQIILKNEESVYVVTPSLNKSFKFQSEWPNNGSQIYLLQPILKDLENDKNRTLEKTKDGYIITSKVNYSSEKDLTMQKVYFDNEKNISKVEILDNEKNIKMYLDVISITYDVELDKNYFNIEKYYKEENEQSNIDDNSVSKIDEVLYPMYVPNETYLTSQDVIETEYGERVILTFSGESNFTFIQEKSSNLEGTNYVYGDPYLVVDNVGTVTDSSVSWISNDIEYSVLSDTMDLDELLLVAQSINVVVNDK